jgi:GGDEF domain-containing protein
VAPLLAALSVLITTVPALAEPLAAPAADRILSALAPILFLVYGFLAWRLNQTRRLLAGGLLALAYLAMGGGALAAGLSDLPHERAWAVAYAVPVGLALLYGSGETALISVGTLIRALLLLALPPLAAMTRGLVAAPATVGGARWALPLPVVALLVPALGVVLLRAGRDRTFEAVLICALAPVFAVVGARLAAVPAEAAEMRRFLFSASAVIGLYGLFRLYWGRVYVDELTGVMNRRALEERMRGLGRRYAIAMVDVDRFKSFNDTYGHAEGDNVLRRVAAHLRDNAAGGVYRYGGEEFAVVYPRTEAVAAVDALEKMREALAGTPFSIRTAGRRKGKSGRRSRRERSGGDRRGRGGTGRDRRGDRSGRQVTITVSVGVADANSRRSSPQSVLEAADRALYEAKKAGRNRVVRKT